VGGCVGTLGREEGGGDRGEGWDMGCGGEPMRRGVEVGYRLTRAAVFVYLSICFLNLCVSV
jgi:hypothetical protein